MLRPGIDMGDRTTSAPSRSTGARPSGTGRLGSGPVGLVTALVLSMALVACAPRGDQAATSAAEPSESLVVASFDFDESRLLAEIYSQALEAAGVRVERQLDLGPRELVLPALQQGLVDLVPEYLGSALAALDPAGEAPADTGQAHQRLASALDRWDVTVLTPAEAQNQNVVVVPDDLAARHGLVTISDLGPLARRLRLAGPPECPQRRHCLPGLRDVYGLSFAQFVAVEGGRQVRRAMEDDVADAGVLFSTDGLLGEPGLTVLADDAGLNPAENVVPVVRRPALDRFGPVVAETVDRVSSHLSAESLRFGNWRVTVAGGEVTDEARGWLVRHGLVPP
jgi:osmoprotectant transport system substrate-binding protein